MKQVIEGKSTAMSLITNGKPLAIIRPWRIKVDCLSRQIEVKRRNWFLIGFDEKTYAFKSVRNVTIDTHLFGANIHVQVYAGKAQAFYIRKRIAKDIKRLLLENDWNKKDLDIIIDMD